MEKLKTVLGILTIGFLIYLYMEHFPDIARSIQRYLFSGFSTQEQHNSVERKQEVKHEDHKKNHQNKRDIVTKSESPDIFQPIDEYEKKAEEEIDKLLELE